jgi:hypothetical protein
MSPKVNEWFSWLPFPSCRPAGFRRKLWLLDPVSGDFSGYYEWQTLDDAHAYAQSFAMRIHDQTLCSRERFRAGHPAR